MLYIDSTSSNEVKEVASFLNNKMVLDITFQIDSFKTEYEVPYHNIWVTITLLDMGYGQTKHSFIVPNLCTWNKDIFINNIIEEYKGITGIVH